MEKSDALEKEKADAEDVSGLQYEVGMKDLGYKVDGVLDVRAEIDAEVTVSGMTMYNYFAKNCLMACIENHVEYLDEWVFCLSDKGDAKDLEPFIKKYPKIRFIVHPSKAKGTSKGRIWMNEADGRNALRDACKSSWLLQVDADELFDPNFLKKMKKVLCETTFRGLFFRKFNLWGDKSHYRVDEPWYPDIGGVKLFRNISDLRYVGFTHPTVWDVHSDTYFGRTRENLMDEHIFHYKRVFPIVVEEDGNFNSLRLDRVDVRPFGVEQPKSARWIKFDKS